MVHGEWILSYGRIGAVHMFTEQSVIDSIRITELGILEVRRADRVFKDGVLIAQSYHRHMLAPGDDLSGEDPKVAAVAQAVWTPELIAAYEASQAIDPMGTIQ